MIKVRPFDVQNWKWGLILLVRSLFKLLMRVLLFDQVREDGSVMCDTMMIKRREEYPYPILALTLKAAARSSRDKVRRFVCWEEDTEP